MALLQHSALLGALHWPRRAEIPLLVPYRRCSCLLCLLHRSILHLCLARDVLWLPARALSPMPRELFSIPCAWSQPLLPKHAVLLFVLSELHPFVRAVWSPHLIALPSQPLPARCHLPILKKARSLCIHQALFSTLQSQIESPEKEKLFHKKALPPKYRRNGKKKSQNTWHFFTPPVLWCL